MSDAGARRSGPGGLGTGVAWAAILLVATASIVIDRLAADSEAGDQVTDAVGLILIQLQGKYIIGAAALMPFNAGTLYTQSEGMLNMGTLPQRQRFVVIAGELAGPAEARRRLEDLDALIAAPPLGNPPEFEPNQVAVQRILHELYPPGLDDMEDDEARAVTAGIDVSPEDRVVIVDGLGWFGELALADRGTGGTDERAALLASAKAVAGTIIGIAMIGLGLGVVGFVCLVLLLVFAFAGRLRSGLGPARASHGVYAETFALWLFLFIGAQQMLSVIPSASLHMVLVVTSFPVSLVALGWPVVRGVPWRDVRHDVGLTLGARPGLEPLIGIGGYVVTLPLLAAGVLLTLALMGVQGAMAGEAPTFAPAGGPAHPVITHFSDPDIGPKLIVLVLATVCAPVVEEIMFRGVLYRHLRGATGRFGTAASVTISTLGNTFLFAAIHPQGFLAIPALMGLACGMTLIREWRGTIIPSIIIHSVSNGIVMGTLWLALSL